MSSQGSPTLDLDVRSRRIESLVVLLTLTLATAAPLLLQIDLLTQAGLIVFSGIVIVAGFWHAGWWGSHRLQRIVWLSDGRWMLSRRHGPPVEVKLLPHSRRGPGCLWLQWQRELPSGVSLDIRPRFGHPSRYAMLLGNGDLPAAQLRRLRVRLAVAPSGPRPVAWLEGAGEVADAISGSLKFGEYLIRVSVWRAHIHRCSSDRVRRSAAAGADQDCRVVASQHAARRP